MAYTDTGRKAEGTAGGATTVNVTHNSAQAGNLLVFGVSHYNGGGSHTHTASDSGGNSWAKNGQALGGVQRFDVNYSVLATGGNLTVTATGPATSDWSAFTHEFSGPHATPVSGTAVGATGTTQTTADTGSFTPADADCLYIAGEGNTASGTITQNVAPGSTDWTLSNEHESGSAAEPGSMVVFIRSGSAVARRAAFTIPSGSDWAAVICGFKPAAAAGVTGTLDETLGDLTLDADGQVAIAASATPTLAGIALDADAVVTIIAGASITLGDLALDGDGAVAVTGVAVVTLEGLGLAAAGSTGGVSGGLDEPLEGLTVSASASVAITAAAAPTLDPLTMTGAGAVAVIATLVRTLDDVALAAIGGGSGVLASLDEALDSLTATAAGAVAVMGTATPELGDLALQASGSVAIRATASLTLGALDADLAGSVLVRGSVDELLQELLCSSAGVLDASTPEVVRLTGVALTGPSVVDVNLRGPAVRDINLR